MARVILDVPTDKMKSFVKAILNLGLDRHAIRSEAQHSDQGHQRLKKRKNLLKAISSSYVLFDWEFFSNELEYE
ncbi:hypothetical protein [Sediminibacterium ginsengisoli]|uniref:Uncharacterized protein n=1 Tax=Sediminibacterium ginsengisoli TaxID=413434 RepID=A0A1T4QG98_9BACT|nr:hypothetical protein [Sediminibacterium ginsengisoli]SKA02647.1 hypothetical protein SAMN04488132_108109 [Sediminibacterium ginsengisoli]